MSKVKFKKYHFEYALIIKTLPYGDEGEADVKLDKKFSLALDCDMMSSTSNGCFIGRICFPPPCFNSPTEPRSPYC
jgi:hypothetical protein